MRSRGTSAHRRHARRGHAAGGEGPGHRREPAEPVAPRAGTLADALFEADTRLCAARTAQERRVVEQQVLALGAADYIVTPFDPAVLTAQVQAVFRRHQLAA